MFIADSFIITTAWKQLTCPSISEWINKLQYIHRAKYHSAIKSNQLLIHPATWTNVRNIMLSETSQAQKSKSYMITFI